MHYLHEVSYAGTRRPDLQLRVWGLRYPTDLRGDVAQIILPLWATISSFTNGEMRLAPKFHQEKKGNNKRTGTK